MSYEIAQHIGASTPNGAHGPDLYDGPALRNVPLFPQTSGGRFVNPPNVRPHTTIAAQSVITAQSAPHRAWEAGYQSPFARALDHPMDPLHDNPQSEHFSCLSDSPHNTFQETRSRDDYSHFPTVNAPVPTPSSNLPASPLAMETTTSQYSHTAPYRPRIRKVITKEVTLDEIDISAMVNLGLSPFMVGQDMIANQNRFVRNECIFARQFLRLQRATGDADARHSKTERDIYKHLEQHKAVLDSFASGSATSTWNLTGTHSTRADPDFLALEKAHQETCAKLEALSRQVSEYSQSMQRTLIDLAQQIDHIIRTRDYSTNLDDTPRSHATTTPFLPLILSTSDSNLKRKWNSSSDSILESPRTMSPPKPNFRNHYFSRA